MILVDKILAVLNDMTSVNTVMYDSGFSANVRIDRKESPYALLYLLSEWTVDISRGTAKEAAELEVFFFDKADFDATGEEKDLVVSSMNEIALEFIATVMADKSINVLDDTVKLRSSYGKFDKFCVGVSVHMNIEVKQGQCMDDLIPEPIPDPDDDPNQTQEGGNGDAGNTPTDLP